ncbi:1-deoxy-D-xylulose-5-phosphate synthase [Aquimarina sp. 2201CG5-10]|uniref:1-deoxy-D-xylulose-5-phosphate synthase n=1 Tax=Aquimarina callyspongiae TaxID=3098150 RepID=UPI002AB3482D|nr:1-deoxy-D-xylulose-5-phosphate synthase [Aquimarina sp. 2201CG5-10]MDY8136860.1 1-deoxy-D-xylulose-5-phosphate synthase [Aquimarina sp. 2201CG5-10]
MSASLLSDIKYPSDLRKLTPDQLPTLAKELRDFVINIVATKEGHLGASLGVIELTIALHYVFDTPNDQLVWDVGHQAYPHKILTGRKDVFHTNRQLGGISGFPKRAESEYDTFGVGHSSTSISATLGMAIASKLKGDLSKQHIAVIGDASIASGMAFEGLNHAGVADANMLIILNDNSIGIDPSVGALKEYLTKAKVGFKPKTDNIIEALNFNYFGPIDGHDLPKLLKTLEKLKSINGPKLLHIITTKGKGLKQAEENQVKYHAPGKFDASTGDLIPKDSTDLPPKFQDVFGYTILELARNNEKIVGITPAMPTGSSLKYMMDEMPDRAFDVGIAEQHAVTLAAGMATQGLVPFCTIYSTFLQRAYDQLIHDVALQNLPVIFCIDRAGIVGADGATHHGVFDIAYLNCIPNMIIAAPANEIELRNLLYTASQGLQHPIAIRYPRGRGTIIDWKKPMKSITIGKATCFEEHNSQIAIISTGTIANNVITALNTLEERISHYHFGFIKPLNTNLLGNIFKKYQTVITIEDGVVKGGFGSTILEYANQQQHTIKIIMLGVSDKFIHQGTTEELYHQCGISSSAIAKTILQHTT